VIVRFRTPELQSKTKDPLPIKEAGSACQITTVETNHVRHQILVRKLAAQGIHDIFNRVRLDKTDAVESQAVDRLVAQVRAVVIEKEVLYFLLPQGKAGTEPGVVAFDKVNAAAVGISVVHPVAVIGGRPWL
jgi:hypothetical protein